VAWLIQLLLMFCRWLGFCLFAATLAAAGCASPATVAPVQTGPGHQETQQGGARTTVPVTIAPVVTPAPAVQVPTSQPAGP